MECLQPTYTRAGIPVAATVHTYTRAYFILYTLYVVATVHTYRREARAKFAAIVKAAKVG